MRQMKESGIEWMGAIPQHWYVIKNKYLINSMYSGGTPSASVEEFYTFEGGVPFVSIGDMSSVSYVDKTGYG